MRLANRIIDVLYCLQTEGGGLGVTDIASRVALPKSTTHRLLQALESRWLVAQDLVTQRYTLGMGLVALSSAVLQEKNILLAPSQGPMEKLRDVSGETVCLHVASGLERVCIRQVESPHRVRYTIEIGKPLPLYSGASGKLLLAYMPERVVDRVIERTRLTPIYKGTITDPATLREQLSAIRRDGYSCSFEETTPLGAAVATSVRDDRGQVIACVTIYGPLMRLGKERIEELLPDLMATAREISNAVAPPALTFDT